MDATATEHGDVRRHLNVIERYGCVVQDANSAALQGLVCGDVDVSGQEIASDEDSATDLLAR